ncbi:PQQ-binding-like beta-propeller repeat protein [Natronococcus sp.]|uniref:outer membrane protein assembly factor BamB family protein n=1 Tax=Natronococcus sp. TaxID=35747 RepID=UPI0025FA27AC|nr:PQQ-binding-like beta-propeller repeat protein [Natronococcus sp.]
MSRFNRRTLMTAGTSLVAGGAFGSLSTAADGGDDEASELPPFEEPDGWSSYYGTAGNTGSVAANGAFPEPETVAWEYDESGYAAVAEGRIYLRTGSEVHALDDGDGSVVWTADGLEAEDDAAYATPAVDGGTVVVGGEELTALDADSGDVQWEQTFDLEDDEAVTSPTVAFDTAFVVAGETLYALDVADGSER